MTELETRAAAVAEADTEAREVRGIAVPWDELADIAGVYRERFVRGSLEPHPAGVKVFDQHRTLVGTATGRDTDRGHEVVIKVARTSAGDDFLELARADALGHLSVGFRPREQRIEEEPADGGLPIITRTRATLAEVSGVPFPAYAGATIAEVRAAASPVTDPNRSQEGTNMPDDNTGSTGGGVDYATADTVTELRSELDQLGRRVDTIGDGAGSGATPSRFRSAGEFLKALAKGEDDARAELRGFDWRDLETRDAGTAPATSALAIPDAGGPGWLNRPLRHVLERRRIINLFSRETLPAEGNTVDWPKVDQAATTGAVEKQASEGTPLTYMEVKLTTGTATVGTYGGFSKLTRQAIERGNPAYLSAVLRYQAIQYAKATNLAARNAFVGMASATPAVVLTGGHAGAAAADWIAAVVDAAAQVEDSSLGQLAEFMVVGRDVFKSIAALTDSSGRPIFALTNGGQAVNVAGSVNPVMAQFNIGGLPGFVDPAVPANTAKVGSSEALTSLESPGAPFRLEDDDVVNLTRDFSLYGYATWTENDPGAVATLDVDGI